MRLQHVGLLVLFYLRFVQRRVLRRGLLASLTARITVAAILLGLFGLLTSIAYIFFSRVAGDAAVLSLFFDLASVNVVLWVLVVFIFIKVLFLKAEHMLALTYRLPVTARERAAALLAFELVLVTVVVAALFAFSVVPIVLLHGVQVLPSIWYAIVCPAIVAHLGLNAAYLAAQRLLLLVGLHRSRAVILLAVSALMAGAYCTRVLSDAVAISAAYSSGESVFTIPGIFSYLAREVGWYAAWGALAAVTATLLLCCIILLPRTYVPSQLYVPLPLGRLVHIPHLGPILAMCVRSSEWVMSAVLGAILGVVFLITRIAPPALGCGLMVFQGMGLYAKAAGLRLLRIGAPINGRSFYLSLLGAQLLAVGPLAIVLTLAAIAAGENPNSPLIALGGLFVGILLVTLIGILFPADRDDPFSAAIGVGVVGCVAILIIAGVSIMNLSPLALLASGLISVIIIISLSLAGISINDRRDRYAESNLGFNGRRNRLAHYPRHSDRGGVMGNVHNDR